MTVYVCGLPEYREETVRKGSKILRGRGKRAGSGLCDMKTEVRSNLGGKENQPERHSGKSEGNGEGK